MSPEPAARLDHYAQKLLDGRIRNTRKLLRTAAVIMSVMLITSSVVTTTLIPADNFKKAAKQTDGLWLTWPTISLATCSELFTTSARSRFCGLPALPRWPDLLTIVPRYLPKYGMAPQWAHATRPLVLVYSVIAFAVTVIFNADVDAQGGAYATGVLVLMTSAAIAVTLAMRKRRRSWMPFLLIAIVFAYTTLQNIHERPEGIKIASFFILAIVAASFVSRVWRSTELRVEKVELDDLAREFVRRAATGTVRIIANRRDTGDALEYEIKEREKRKDNHIPTTSRFCFLK